MAEGRPYKQKRPEINPEQKEQSAVPGQIIDRYLSAKTYEEEEEVLRSLKDLTEEQLKELEKQLAQKEVKERAKLHALKLKTEIQLGKVLELLPEYPVSSKVAVIINGDPHEDRHVENVDKSIRSLAKIGFTEFLVVNDGKIPEISGTKIEQFPPTKKGADDMFSALGAKVKKDSMVFFYATGHGGPDQKDKPDSGGIALTDSMIGKKYLTEQLQMLRKKEARGVFTFDPCYSGVFPEAVILSGIQGVAFSSAIKGKESECQFFAPEVFKLIEQGCDLNKDHLTTMQEIYKAAMTHYRIETKTQEFGEVARSLNELTTANFDEIVGSKKPTLVVIRTTWCPSCDVQDKELGKIWGIIGDNVNIVHLTTDTDEKNAKKVMRKMGIRDPDRIPAIYFTRNSGKSFEQLSQGAKTREELTVLISQKTGVKFEEQDMVNALAKRTGKKFEEVKKFVDVGIIDHEVIANINYFDDFMKAKDAYPNTFSIQEKALLFTKGIIWRPGTRYPADLPAKYFVKIHESYDGDWVSVWEGNKKHYSPEEFTKIILTYFSDHEHDKFDLIRRYDKDLPLETRMELLKAGIKPKDVKTTFAKYPKEMSNRGKAYLASKKITPELVQQTFQRRFSIPIDRHDKITILEFRGSIPDTFESDYVKYAPEFDHRERCFLYGHKITPEQANEYSKVINVGNIKSLIELKIPQEKFLADAEKYPMFATNVIIYFYQQHVDLEQAKEYDLQRFSPPKIARLFGARTPDSMTATEPNEHLEVVHVPPEVANRYHLKLKPKTIIGIYRAGIMPEDVNENIGKYKDAFNEGDIMSLCMRKVPADEANKYIDVFENWNKGTAIADFYRAGVLVPELLEYKKNGIASMDDAKELLMAKPPVPTKMAMAYGIWEPKVIIDLFHAGITPEQYNQAVEEYKDVFNFRIVGELLKEKIPLETAKKYPKGFYTDNIVKLYKKGISPQTADAKVTEFKAFNGQRFSSNAEIGALLAADLTPELANKYPKEMDAVLIGRLFEKGKTPEEVTKMWDDYDARFTEAAKQSFLYKGVSPEVANDYPTECHYFKILNLYEKNILPAELRNRIKRYDSKFNVETIIDYILEGITPENALKREQ